MQKLSPVILVFCLSLLLVSCANEEITKSDELKPFSLVSPPSNDVNEEERDKILSVVLLTDLAFEACGYDHPSLKPQLQEAFAAWKKRNHKYVIFAHQDSRYELFKKKLQSTKPQTPDGLIPEAQCRDTIQTLHTPEADIDSIRARQNSAKL